MTTGALGPARARPGTPGPIRSRAAARPRDPPLQVTDLRLDDGARTVSRAGVPVSLSPLEYELLRALMARPGQVLSRDDLERRLRSLGRMTNGADLAVHIHHLRRKIGGDRIRTVRGVGYVLPRDAVHW